MNPELLIDIARLIRKYPPEVWEDLTDLLHRPELRERVLYLAREMSKLSHQARAGLERNAARAEDDIVFRRALLLDQIRTDLETRRGSEVRDYARSLGMGFDKSTTKEVLISRILKMLAAKDVEEIERVRTPTLFSRPVREDYERWGELIMGKKTKPKR